MSAVAERTVSRSRASLTPPALPRPPACTWALTTHSLPPNDCAAATASSALFAAFPAGPEFRTRGTLLLTGIRGGSSGPGLVAKKEPVFSRNRASGRHLRPRLLIESRPMPLVAAAPPAPTDLAWRVIGLVNLYRLLIPPALYALFAISPAGDAHRRGHPELFLWTCVVYFAAGIAIVVGGRRLLPNLRATTFVHAMVDAVAISLLMFSSGGVAAASASCSWCRSAPWPCWPTAATPSCSRHWPRWRCWRSRSAAHVTGNGRCLPTTPPPASSAASCFSWPCSPGRGAPPARHRGHGAPPAGRSREPGAAVAVHRAAPAREHRGGRPRKPHPADQRIRGAAARRPRRLSRARCSAKPRRSCSIYWRPGAQRTATPAAPSQTFVAADGGHVIQPHFALARWRRALARHRVPRRHRAARGQDPAVEARGPRPAVRQHRARDPQPRGRHEPCGAAAGRIHFAVGRRQAPHRDRPHQRRPRAADHRERHVDGAPREFAARAPGARPLARRLPRRVLRHHADSAGRGSPSPRCSATSRYRSILRSCARSCGTCARTR